MVSTTVNLMPCAGSLALDAPRPRLRVIEGGLSAAPARTARPQAGACRAAHGARSRAQLAILAVAALAMVLATWRYVDGARSARVAAALAAARYEEVVVVQGDTLWSIAESHPVEGCSTAELVRGIREANGLTGAGLGAGTRLSVPVSDVAPGS